MYYFLTKKSNFADEQCETLRVYGTYYIFMSFGFVAISIFVAIYLKCCPNNTIIIFDRVVKMIGYLVIYVLFQIGYVQSSNCGAFGVFVCINLVCFYIFISCMICLLMFVGTMFK